ncbi:MAG: response regulator [Bacteroidales bacterium]|nr:response regulator [Bacteroidales bacterium]
MEDSRHDLELIQEQLSDAGYVLDLTHVVNQKGFISALKQHSFDIILSDFNLPGFDAFEALQISNEVCPEIPFICISGSIGEETAIELLKRGAVDYVLKDRPERLPFAVKRALDEAKEKLAHNKAEKALQESEHRFKQVAENAQEWIWEVNKNGLYTYTSPVIKSLLGYSAEEIVSKKHFYDLLVPEKMEEIMASYFEFFSRKESFRNFENPTVHKNGQIIILNTSGSPILDENGEILGYRGVNADITESKKMLEEIVFAKEKAEESDKLKTAFINNISHEIRTPLNGILGFGQFLADSDLTEIQRMKYFSIMQKSSNRLMNTVSDYMDMAWIVSGTMEVHTKDFPLQPLFNEIAENTRQACIEKNIEFEAFVPIDPENLTLHSNSEFLRKILNNLLNNALKFTKEGRINCGYTITPGFIDFSVQDTGCGIAPDKLEIIFNMFSQEDSSNTRGYEGSGLGLAIAQGLVKLLGGTIKVMSEKGKGSVFTVSIPYVEPTPVEKQTIAKTSGTTNTNKPLVLIAEDEETNYLYVEVVMKMADCGYIHVNNGAEAVEICRQNDKITLVLMDIKMPVMNGLEATQMIHEFRPELPIIAMTAYAQTDDEYRFLAAGCNDYLAKPIKKDNLLSLLQKYA